MDDLEVHECDLFEHEPFTVDCMALDERQGILAVARHSDRGDEEREGIVEFWNTIGSPIFHVRTTPLGAKSAESLLWKGDVLLASHLDGSITGHRLHTSEYFTTRLTPSPMWCLASMSGSAFCAGSDSGAVFLFSLEDGDRIVLNKTVSIGFGVHVMSLACNGDIIAAGMMDEISLISVQKTRIEHTLKLPRVEKRKPTIVWCLCFIGDQLASGDSRGYVTFWNASNGAFSHCLQTHQADVLSMAVADESLYAAGVDPTIARLAFNQDRTAYRVEHRRRIHSNDVRAMAASKHTTALYSGGADYYFCLSSRLKHTDGLKNVACCVAPDADLFSYQYSNHIVIWKAGTSGVGISKKGICPLKNGPVKLAQLRSHRGEFIISSALSREGSLLAISTSGKITLYKLDFNSSTEPRISVLKRLNVCRARLLFTSTSLFITSGGYQVSVLRITDSIAECPETVSERGNAGEVIRLHSSTDETSLVLLTTRNELFILNIREKMKTRLFAQEFTILFPRRFDVVRQRQLENIHWLKKGNLRKLEISGSDVFIDAHFINATSLYILCADLKRTLIEYSTDSNVLSGNVISTESLCMSSDETVMEMDCSDSGGIVLTGSRGSFRIITLINGKRVLLCGPEACALKKEATTEDEEGEEEAGVCLMRKDRCSRACWLSARKLLFTTPIMLAEPSQTAFRLKRYGQN